MLAAAITGGKPRISHVSPEGLNNPEVLDMAGRVSYRLDKEYDEVPGTGAHPVRMVIKLKDGRVLEAEDRDLRYGHSERPMGWNELVEKFRDCAAYSLRPLPGESVDGLIEMISNLEQVEDVTRILSLLA